MELGVSPQLPSSLRTKPGLLEAPCHPQTSPPFPWLSAQGGARSPGQLQGWEPLPGGETSQERGPVEAGKPTLC